METDGIASTDLSMLERGLRPLFPGWRSRIARALGVSASALFADFDSAQLEENVLRDSARLRVRRGGVEHATVPGPSLVGKKGDRDGGE